MLRIKIIATVLILLLQISSGFSQNRKCIEKDYTLLLPADWVPLPKERLEEIQRSNAPDLRTYVVGFSAGSSGGSYPYVVANYNEIPGSGDALFKDVLDIQHNILKKQGLHSVFVVDSNRYTFYAKQQLNEITLYMGYSLGGNGILYLQYFSDGSYPEKDAAQFTSILNSIEHKVKFLNRNRHLEEAEKHTVKSGQYAILAFIGLAIYLIIYFVRRRKKSTR